MPIVYIGEAENCFDRLKQHNREKDFWDSAVVLLLELEFIFVEDTGEYREKTVFSFVDDYKIAKSNWENILRQTNYLMSESVPISVLISTDPSWSNGLKTLQKARNHLNSGDGVAALDEVEKMNLLKIHKIRDGNEKDNNCFRI